MIPHKTQYINGYICRCLALFFILTFIRLPEYHILQFHAFCNYKPSCLGLAGVTFLLMSSISSNNLNINLNQNMWLALIGLSAMGLSEHYRLCVTFWFGFILTCLSILSLIPSLIAYTKSYWQHKMSKQ